MEGHHRSNGERASNEQEVDVARCAKFRELGWGTEACQDIVRRRGPIYAAGQKWSDPGSAAIGLKKNIALQEGDVDTGCGGANVV